MHKLSVLSLSPNLGEERGDETLLGRHVRPDLRGSTTEQLRDGVDASALTRRLHHRFEAHVSTANLRTRHQPRSTKQPKQPVRSAADVVRRAPPRTCISTFCRIDLALSKLRCAILSSCGLSCVWYLEVTRRYARTVLSVTALAKLLSAS